MKSNMMCKIHEHVHSYFTMNFDFKQLQWKTIWKNKTLDGCQIFSTKRDTRQHNKGSLRGGVEVKRSPRMREIGVRSQIGTDLSR